MGCADELIQLFNDRGSQITDVLIDSTGALLGAAAAAGVAAICRRRGD